MIILLILIGKMAFHISDPPSLHEPEFDLVLTGGRVIDPETGLDAIRNIGISNGKIAAISNLDLDGASEINVDGLVVAPGFIDLHAHGQLRVGQELQAQDGVTTALEMEFGAFPISEFYERRKGRALINYGATVSHECIRIRIKYDLPCYDAMEDTDPAQNAILKRSPKTAFMEPANQSELEKIESYIVKGLEEGGLGVGLGIEYTPGAGRKEIYEIFKTAAAFNAPIFAHARRRKIDEAPGAAIVTLQELIADAAITGAPLQFVHIASTGLLETPIMIEMIEKAQEKGIKITTETYPYTASSTSIGAALFDGPWREVYGIDYDSVDWAATGEKLTKERFEQLRREQPAGTVIVHKIPSDIVSFAVANPTVSIVSDGMPWRTGHEHPRGAGTFARVLGKYVREEQALDLKLAIGKMTIMPANTLESFVPTMKNKGRIQIGSDADITVFDPETVIDKATFEKPMQPSGGIEFVLVGGVLVVNNGKLVPDVSPGKPIINGLIRD